MTELLARLEAALSARNPTLIPTFQPPLDPNKIRKDLKRVGIVGAVEPIVQMYTWHNGTKFVTDTARNLGFAPPVVSELPQAHKDFLAGLGKKVDPNHRIYSAYFFFEFEGLIRDHKHWKKFVGTDPRYYRLIGRYAPMFSNTTTAAQLAVDVHPDFQNRVVIIQTNESQDPNLLRLAYGSFTEFLEDLVDANERNELLKCVQSPGEPIK